jgi:hypothetical protein
METNSPNLPAVKKHNNWRFIWNNKLVLFILLIMVAGAVWAAVKYNTLKRSTNKEKLAITSRFVGETSRVFSWAIRSEMQRDNLQQVNQFFMTLVKEPGFRKIQLIDVKNSQVLISTDKKDEGTVVSDTSILNASVVKQQVNGDIIRSVTPVMGLNSRIGILVIDRIIPQSGTEIE